MHNINYFINTINRKNITNLTKENICFAFFFPSFACFAIFASFNEIKAISLAAKYPLTKIKIITLVFGELVPKRLAMKHYEKISYMTIGVIRAIYVVTVPFVKLLTI